MLVRQLPLVLQGDVALGERCWTVILVLDARSAFRRIRVPVRLMRIVAGAAGAVALTLAALLAHYAWLTHQASALEALRVENSMLSERTHRHAERLGQLESRVARLRSTLTRLAAMPGLEQTLPAEVGVGGAPGVDPDPPSCDPDLILPALSRNLADLTARAQRIESFYADRATLLSHTPSVWPVRGYFSSGFGSRVDPFTGEEDFHPGIDVSAPLGTKAVAPADGVVVAVGPRGAYGLAIIIDHGYGVVTRYGHLEGFAVRPGQRVRRGDVIGFVGSTGRSNAPHLHYEVWLNDKPQDPIHYILDEYRSFG
jgi:murein DD-endopeptidase MepM/ murein hydrolase activator NlpD